jgi:ACR3 family arsenite transporter|tara:strand:- start:7009 stop:8064 length:1056 start_codon:yes stop_codon:yes gene_type:complete
MFQEVSEQLSRIDKLLPIWIVIAMVIGIGTGAIFPELANILDTYRIYSVSLPIAIGLLCMMYPPLAKVRYEKLSKAIVQWKMFAVSLTLNWIIGPVLMFSLAWIFLPDLPEYRTGIILVGLARCIAMVLIWNHLAGGSNEQGVILVALNSVFQILMYSIYAYFFITVLSSWITGSTEETLQISMTEIARSVIIFLGIPVIAGIITRFTLVKNKGKTWYDEKFIPKLSPTAILGLLFTIIVMFSMKGEFILTLPWDVLRISLPLVAYFLIMFAIAFFLSWALKFTYQETATLSLTAASNNFELAIAVTIGIFGLSSNEAFAAIIGPLIEVPVLISLVYISLWLKNKLFWNPE